MGRHSVPDDDPADAPAAVGEPSGGATAVAVVTAPEGRGRHARSDEVATPDFEDGDIGDAVDGDIVDAADGGLTAELLTELGAEHGAVAAEDTRPAPTEQTAPLQPAPSEQTARRVGGFRSDLRLLRQHGDVRARVIAGVLVPFAVFTVVMALLDRLDRSYLIWIWIPLVTAGVLGGLFLDLGHRRYAAGEDPEPRVAPQR